MKISLKNIGKVKEADIDIKGITVIAGENNSGKSTIGRVLFSVFNSFYNIEATIAEERKKLIRNRIISYLYSKDTFNTSIEKTFNLIENTVERLVKSDIGDRVTIENILKKDILDIDNKFWGINKDKESQYLELESISETIFEILKLDNNYIFKYSFQKNLRDEFNNQINNLYTKELGIIELSISDKKIKAEIDENKIENIKGIEEKILSLNTRAIYIDDPFVLDNDFSIMTIGHKEHLKSILNMQKKDKNLVEDALSEKKLEKIEDKLKNILEGEIIVTENGLSTRLKNTNEYLDIKNLSTGLKTFAILKILLNNGMLERNGTIILDEPEIHLHPEWQLVFAEIIVLLQKEFGLHILLATHSPYFLRAIQVYSANYSIADRCKYYLSENEGRLSNIKDVTENIDLIYKKLSYPLQVLENLSNEEL